MNRIEPHFGNYTPSLAPVQTLEVVSHSSTRTTFEIIPPVENEGWTVVFHRPGDDAVVYLSNVNYFSTVAQMVAEGLRIVSGEGELEVIDPTGSWEYWLTHSATNAPRKRSKIPTHFH